MFGTIRSLGRQAGFLSGLARSRAGNATILMAVGAPVLISAAGFGIDTAQWYMWKRELQYAVDQAAIGGAWSLAKGVSKVNYSTHVQQEFTANLATTHTFASTPSVAILGYNGGTANAIRVSASATKALPFFGFVSGKSTTVAVTAQASFAKGATYTSCLIATNPTASGAITIGGNPVLTSGCGLAALSNSTNAVVVNGNPTISVNYVLAAGGIDDWFNTTSNTVKEYMTTLSDPFIGLTAPSNPTVGTTYKCVKSGSVTQATLSPGTYSSINTSCNTVFNSGIYVIDGGTFTIRSQDSVTGDGVMFVLKNGASVTINGGGAINLSAMTTSQLQSKGISATQSAALEGMLVFEDKNSAGSTSTLNGNSSSVFNGTIYLPKSLLKLNGTARVTSRCLQITANMISVQGNANFTNFCPSGQSTSTQAGSESPKVILVS